MPETILHPIPPFYTEQSRVLILGSFPSVKSREMAFFYGHPQNRFWRVLAAVFEDEVPWTLEERKAFLDRHRVACWDVIRRCEIEGSADVSIRGAEANDLRPILKAAPIARIYVNGRTAEKLYQKLIEPQLGRAAVCLPSTSPANAAWSLDRLISVWRQIKIEV